MKCKQNIATATHFVG